MEPTAREAEPQPIKAAKTSQISFAIMALGYEIAVCLVYGLLFDYETEFNSSFHAGDVILISILSMLAILGFGLVNSYITNSAFSGMAMSLLIFGLTIQNYFLMRAFWYKVGVYSPNATNTFGDQGRFRQISYVNRNEDLQLQTYQLPVSSMADAIACSISLMIAFSPVVGRVSLPEIFLLTLFGPFAYEVNSQLLWRLFITDAGYGLRVFTFGSFLGLISACILGKKQTTRDHHRYFSNYASQSFGLIGTCFIVCALPFLTAASLYRTSSNDSAVLWIAGLNMWMSLIAGILGAFTACAMSYAKVFLHDIVFGGIAGGIAYSSSADLHYNLAAPLAVGYITGIASAFANAVAHRKMNSKGVIFSMSLLNRFIFPSVICGIMSAVLQGIGQTAIGTVYSQNFDSSLRSTIGQGGFQLIGLALSIGFGVVIGIIIGLLYKLLNRHNNNEQFDDRNIFYVEPKRND